MQTHSKMTITFEGFHSADRLGEATETYEGSIRIVLPLTDIELA